MEGLDSEVMETKSPFVINSSDPRWAAVNTFISLTVILDPRVFCCLLPSQLLWPLCAVVRCLWHSITLWWAYEVKANMQLAVGLFCMVVCSTVCVLCNLLHFCCSVSPVICIYSKTKYSQYSEPVIQNVFYSIVQSSAFYIYIKTSNRNHNVHSWQYQRHCWLQHNNNNTVQMFCS